MRSNIVKFSTHEIFFEDLAGFNMCEKLYPAERWTWIALRALAARSKYCPLVCITPNKGWPDEMLHIMLKTNRWAWNTTKRKLVAYGKIEVDEKTNVIKVNHMDWWVLHGAAKLKRAKGA